MQRSARLLSTALPRALPSSSTTASSSLTAGKTATNSLRARASPSIPVNLRTAATAAVKTAPAANSKTPYSNYKSAAPMAPAKTPRKTTKSQVAAPGEPAPKPSEPVFDPTFPVPQPAAALPDYAALAPPLHPTPPSPLPPHSIHLVEAPGFADSAESLHAGSDWSTSFHGLSSKPFDKEVAQILMRPLNIKDIEIKPGMWIALPNRRVFADFAEYCHQTVCCIYQRSSTDERSTRHSVLVGGGWHPEAKPRSGRGLSVVNGDWCVLVGKQTAKNLAEKAA